MSIRVIDLASSKKRNVNVQKRVLQHQNEVQKHFVFPKPETPLLSDKSEFPSLSESLGRASNYLPFSGGSLKYSDKLKSPSSLSKNQASVSGNNQFNCSTPITDIQQCDSKVTKSKFQNIDNKNKLSDNSKQNVPKQVSDHFLNKSKTLNKEKSYSEKRELMKQKPVLKSISAQNNQMLIKLPTSSSDDANMLSKSIIQPNKFVNAESGESKGENSATQDNSKAKKKKKRKSKVKRQVALQSGKITFLTPEVHSKILNQSSTLTAHSSVRNSIIGNIDDEEEYPELGKAVLPSSQKENFLRKNIFSKSQVEAVNKSADSSVETNAISENIVKEIPVTTTVVKTVVEKKEKVDKVHSHNPITISFYDMLLEKNVKKKEIKELKNKTESFDVIGLSKFKNKKNVTHPHNLLDASSPAVKRGKEREKPKPKKPSQLKKIILLDRKARREYLLQMKNSFDEENVGLVSTLPENEDDQAAEEEAQFENNFECDLSAFWKENEESVEGILQLNESTDICDQDELTSEMLHLNISEDIDNYDIISDLSSNFEEVNEKEDFIEKSISTLPLNEISRCEIDDCMASQISNQLDFDTEMHLNVPQSPESLLNSLIGNIKADTPDKDKAVKILLHTRNFREYCNHLISKDIDDVTYALLDDLARFQDRLHQKDPVKARMKRRMIYGVKEVKKHIKLRKLKCIIMATDIENVETQGGLNDILNEIKVSAVDHHIPYVFALSRKVLGKVCRKPVPVSCVGVFNYEGSETNFKKMVELQSQSKADYAEIFNKLLVKITDEEVAALIKAKKEAPETLRDVRANALSNFFVPFDLVKSEDENNDSQSNDDMLNLIDLST